MLDNTLFLFSVTLPDGEVMEVYRQDERDTKIDAFIYIVVNRYPNRTPLIFIYHDYDEMREFIHDELEYQTVIELAAEEAQL